MTMVTAPSDLTIFSGRFGSGKTEVAINYALALAAGEAKTVPCLDPAESLPRATPGLPPDGVVLIDLDIVTPYFRSRETAAALKDRGVEVIAPSAIGQHLDTPAITPQILGAIQRRQRPTILDVGGDRQGARALGQFSKSIEERGYAMLFVVNPFRPFTGTLEGLRRSIEEIEASARLQVSFLVSNPNLMGETATEQVLEGHSRIEEFASALELPIAFICVDQERASDLVSTHFSQPLLILDRHFVQPWDADGEA
jgi:hypothetical protein